MEASAVSGKWILCRPGEPERLVEDLTDTEKASLTLNDWSNMKFRFEPVGPELEKELDDAVAAEGRTFAFLDDEEQE